ncbi:MAG: hypothetical protein JJT88_12840, partial [Gammaproteobacteria bacterium]|nr:hypothetical protein [Gammaproteobacteria bacterium]
MSDSQGTQSRGTTPTGTSPTNAPAAGSNGLTYRDAGVDIDAGAELIRRIAPAAERTRRPEMLDGLGGVAPQTPGAGPIQKPVVVARPPRVGP